MRRQYSGAGRPPNRRRRGRAAVGLSSRLVSDEDDAGPGAGHLTCPFCGSYETSRMFLASLRLDSCECAVCGARWDEEVDTGQYRGRASRASAATPRDR